MTLRSRTASQPLYYQGITMRRSNILPFTKLSHCSLKFHNSVKNRHRELKLVVLSLKFYPQQRFVRMFFFSWMNDYRANETQRNLDRLTVVSGIKLGWDAGGRRAPLRSLRVYLNYPGAGCIIRGINLNNIFDQFWFRNRGLVNRSSIERIYIQIGLTSLSLEMMMYSLKNVK